MAFFFFFREQFTVLEMYAQKENKQCKWKIEAIMRTEPLCLITLWQHPRGSE
jgi:hypothetical protein